MPLHEGKWQNFSFQGPRANKAPGRTSDQQQLVALQLHFSAHSSIFIFLGSSVDVLSSQLVSFYSQFQSNPLHVGLTIIIGYISFLKVG